jgi:hypothetical protein
VPEAAVAAFSFVTQALSWAEWLLRNSERERKREEKAAT